MAFCDNPSMVVICETHPNLVGMLAGGQAAANAPANAFNKWIEGMTQAMLQGLGKAVAFLTTWWIHVPTPGLSSTDGPVAQIQHHVAWFMLAAGMLGLILAGGKLAIAQRGGEQLRETSTGLGRLILIGAAGTAIISTLTVAGDAFSSWIIQRASGADLGGALAPYMALQLSGFGNILLVILAAIAIIGSFVQAFLMFVRSGMLVLVAGVLPLAAAAAVSGGLAKKTLDKLLSWTAAFVLFKPVAAIVYAATFWMIADDDPNAHIVGMFMIIMATAALPALMRVITPQVEGMTSGGGGQGAGMAAGQAAASGARMLGSAGGGGGKSGGGSGGGGKQPGLAGPGGAAGGGGGGTGAKSAAAAKPAASGGAAAGGGATAGAATAAGPAGAAVAATVGSYKAVKGTAQKSAEQGGAQNNTPPPGGARGGQG